MKLVKYRTRPDLFSFPRDIDRVFGDVFENFAGGLNTISGDWLPRANVVETDEAFIIHAELPGLNKDDVKITFRDGILTFKGEKKREETDEGVNYHHIERSYGTFERSFKLRSLVKPDEIKADFQDGILKISLPKAEEVKPKEIEISLS